MVELEKQDYNKNRDSYLKIEKRLKEIISIDVPIDHVGSTAVPNILYGKNIIDILIGAHNLDEYQDILEKLTKENLYASSKSKNDEYQFIASTNEESKSGDFHIHLVLIDTERYKEFLILKEYLTQNDMEANNYSNLKQKITSLITKERKEYKRIKSEYVSELLIRAKDWYKEYMNMEKGGMTL